MIEPFRFPCPLTGLLTAEICLSRQRGRLLGSVSPRLCQGRNCYRRLWIVESGLPAHVMPGLIAEAVQQEQAGNDKRAGLWKFRIPAMATSELDRIGREG